MYPYPDESTWWAQFEAELSADYLEAGVPLDWAAFRWAARTGYDIAAGLTPDAALTRHRAEWRAALGLIAPPPPLPSFPDPPSRERRLAVRADFCNLWDAKGRPMFSPFLGSLPLEDRRDWYARFHAERDTHVVLAWEYGYAPYEQQYGLAKRNFNEHENEFCALVSEVIHDGFVPIVFLSGDGILDQAVIRRRVGALTAPVDVRSHCVWLLGWELVKGNLTSKQFNECNLTLADAIGPEAILGCHLSPSRLSFSSHPVEPDDPWHGDEMACWNSGCGPRFDVFLAQFVAAREWDLDEFGQEAWEDSAIEMATRVLPPGTPMPGAKGHRWRDKDRNVRVHTGVAGAPNGPYWFGQRPTRAVCAFESPAYWAIRNRSTPMFIRHVAQRLQSFGYTSFGNGQP